MPRAVLREHPQRRLGVAHAVDIERDSRPRGWREQEVAEFLASLAVAPVADPDDAVALALLGGRTEQRGVGRLVPDEGAPPPSLRAIHFGERRAEGEHAVVAGEIERPQRRRLADAAMMRVVEQEGEPAARDARASDGGDQRRVGPFMDENDIGGVGHRGHIGRGAIPCRGEFGEIRLEPCQRVRPVIGEKIGAAPPVCRLERLGRVAARPQLPEDAAQEVRVAVIPAGGERVDEVDEAHQAAAVRAPASTERCTPAVPSTIASAG